MLNLSAALRVHVCCCLWVSIEVAERSPGSVSEFKFRIFCFCWVELLGMWFSASPWQDECGVWSVKPCNALRQPSLHGICVSYLGNISLWGAVWLFCCTMLIHSSLCYTIRVWCFITLYCMTLYNIIAFYVIVYYIIAPVPVGVVHVLAAKPPGIYCNVLP